MKRLIFAVYDDCGEVFTHSKEFECGHDHNNVKEMKDEILESIAVSGMDQDCLNEVFVFESVLNDAPKIAAHWAYEDF